MKKNLKKVLSAVIAMALAFSLVPASFAAKVTLSDVADTASYATAVNTLVALKVINGYEDGTFLPDNKITRAEATKVMVAALNQLDAAEGMKGATQFTDVEAKHEWATGYINAGVQNGYINGMGDGTFAPDAEVTYAQMVKMLVSAMNYDQYAAYLGGYPNGYLSIAASEKITDGVNANANDAVTRAQVAQLVYNALNAPIVENTGMTWTSDGKLVPTIKKMDGKGTGDAATNYKSILTEYFNAYYVEGWVVETSKDEGSSLENDEVVFGIAKTQKYDQAELGSEAVGKNVVDMSSVLGETEAAKARRIQAYVGDTDAAEFKGTYATAIIMEDEYEDKYIVSFQASGKNKSVKIDADLFDEYNDEKKLLEVYASENATRTTDYRLQKTEEGALNIDVYVNGFKVSGDAAADKAAIENYVLKNAVGEVELVDTYKTDGYYDTIYVNVYATGIVRSVDLVSKEIKFKGGTITKLSALTDTEFVLDEEKNEKLQYKIIYNGEEITLAEIKEGDVLSIAYNVTEDKFADCNSFVIYVARDVKTGKFTSLDTENKEYTIGGEVYSYVKDSAMLTSADLTNEYTIYVDAFGRIAFYELNVTAEKYAIVDKAFNASGSSYDNNRVRIYTADGEIKTLEFEPDAVVTKPDGDDEGTDPDTIANAAKAEGFTALDACVAGQNIEDRVVKYAVKTSTGRIKSLEFIAAGETVAENTKEFKAETSKLGSIEFTDATKIINAITYINNGENASYSDLEIAELSDLSDGVQYEAYAYAKNPTTRKYAFVLITKGKALYNEETKFAVIAGATSIAEDETAGEKIYTVAIAGQEDKIEISEDAKVGETAIAEANLTIGDVIIYSKGANGRVDDIQVLFNTKATATKTEGEGDDAVTTVSFKNIVDKVAGTVLADSTDSLTRLPAAGKSSNDWTKKWVGTQEENDSDDPIRVIVGAVVDRTASAMKIARIKDNKIDIEDGTPADGVLELDLASDTAVYTYDFDEREQNRVKTGSIDSIDFVEFDDDAYIGGESGSKTVLDWTKTEAKKELTIAVVKTVDDEVVDVLYIKGDYTAE